MSVVKEVLYDIDYWSLPLKKHRYSLKSVARKAYTSNGTASGILLDEIREREREASGHLSQRLLEVSESDNVLIPVIEAASAPVPVRIDQKKESAADRRFRVLKKKVDSLVYDYSAVRQGELEDEVFEILNKDGFYDEILPIDYYLDSGNEIMRASPWKIALYVALLIVMIAGTAIGIKILLF